MLKLQLILKDNIVKRQTQLFILSQHTTYADYYPSHGDPANNRAESEPYTCKCNRN